VKWLELLQMCHLKIMGYNKLVGDVIVDNSQLSGYVKGCAWLLDLQKFHRNPPSNKLAMLCEISCL
jgi:hypothetical protein